MKKTFSLAFATFSLCGLSLFANGVPLETKETEKPVALEDSTSKDTSTSTRLLGCGAACQGEEETKNDSRYFLIDGEEEESHI